MSELLKLADRCEKATGEDQELDRDIHWIGAMRYIPNGGDVFLDPQTKAASTFKVGGAPHYTRSMDAAMLLVPEDWFLTLDRFAMSDDPAPNTRTWRVWLKRFVGDFDGDDPCYQQKVLGPGATPALAMCAAALRARDALSRVGRTLNSTKG